MALFKRQYRFIIFALSLTFLLFAGGGLFFLDNTKCLEVGCSVQQAQKILTARHVRAIDASRSDEPQVGHGLLYFSSPLGGEDILLIGYEKNTMKTTFFMIIFFPLRRDTKNQDVEREIESMRWTGDGGCLVKFSGRPTLEKP